MNKKARRIYNLFLLLLIVGMAFPKMVLAADANSLEGPSLSSPGETISIDIKVNADTTINKYKAELRYETSVLELTGIENKSNWKGNNALSGSPATFEFNHENGVAGETVIATLKFKVKQDATKAETSLTLIGTAGLDDTAATLPEISKNISIKSTDNTLKDLKLNGKTVVNFSPSTYSYSMQVEAITTTANIDATLNSNTASFVDKYGSRSVPLEYGENVIEVKVMSASNSEKTYVINVTRLDNRGSNNNLKSLILNSGKVKLNFDKDTLEYKIKTYKLSDIDIEAVPEDTKATVSIDKPEHLSVGENTINIVVTSEDGNEKTYKITLNNVDYDIDTTLKDIELFGADEELDFDPKVLDYEIKYKSKYANSLVIKPIINTDDEDVQIDEPLLEKTASSLKVGSVIQIRVYASDGTESIYTITLTKDNRLNFFFILGLVIFIILLIIFIKLMIDNKKNKNKRKDVEEEKEEQKEIEKTKRLKKINLE